MWITYLQLNNIRSFNGPTDIGFGSGINLLVGSNNSGKSTILSVIHCLQQLSLNYNDITLSHQSGSFSIGLGGQDIETWIPQGIGGLFEKGVYHKLVEGHLRANSGVMLNLRDLSNQPLQFNPISPKEPNNLIYPYLSKRKVWDYSETINDQITNTVTGNLTNLYAKVDRLANRYYMPAHEEYNEACTKIIGFPISTISSTNGKKAALIIRNSLHIPLSSMGEGVANLLGLIVDLCNAENKVFLIEEIENDIHPKALKALLDLIIRRSSNNQFFISTHSNIVTKYLGSAPGSKIFSVHLDFKFGNYSIPKSIVTEIETTEQRLNLLEELGYEPYDFDTWSGWLFTEEASAEWIIREFLIPEFVPTLSGILRTFSCRTASEVEPKFKDFNNLFVFLHLEPVYKNKAWVVIDSGDEEEKIMTGLKETYIKNGWKERQFRQFSKHDFEDYYPDIFDSQRTSIKKSGDKKDKRERKMNLLEDVKKWIRNDISEAKKAFENSAKEVIELLKEIDSNLKK